MNKGSKLKKAILYATSLYEGAALCHKLKETREDAENLRRLLNDGIKDFALLNNPIWSLDAKEKLADAVIDKMKLNRPLANLLKILIENRQIDSLELILLQFKEIYNARQNIAEVRVETVEKLTPAQDIKLKEKLSALFKKDIIIDYIINPQILGGLVIKCGTVLIDSSVMHQLDNLEQLMKGTK
ncbi:MAG: ATP synthase F1 subunit delta [Pseudomonadota bacterium]|nr:ATP synthase F1 subunit delta [Pseudomonadota bacterium]